MQIKTDTSSVSTVRMPQSAGDVIPQGTEGACNCGGGEAAELREPTYIYAVGRIEARFPRLSIEKEFLQAAGREDAKGLTDQQTFHSVLSQPRNLYLARQMCWVMSVQGIDTYLLVPRCPSDLQLLIDSIRPMPRETDLDVVIGTRGPLAPPTMCNGLVLPLVGIDQVYSFDINGILNALPRPEGMEDARFRSSSEELIMRLLQLTDNAGAEDSHRAVNYLAVRYQGIYKLAAEQFGRNFSLSGVDVQPSRLSGTRRIVDVIFSHTHRDTDVMEKFFVRVDVTEQFPFLVSKIQPFFDRQ